MNQHSYREVAVLNPASRLPRPMTIKKWPRDAGDPQTIAKASGPVLKLPQLNNSKLTIASRVSFPHRVQQEGAAASRIPVPHSVTCRTTTDRPRPQTSNAMSYRRKSTGRSNVLLRRIETMPTQTDEDDGCFTRFQPLPAIGRQELTSESPVSDRTRTYTVSSGPLSDEERDDVTGTPSTPPSSPVLHADQEVTGQALDDGLHQRQLEVTDAQLLFQKVEQDSGIHPEVVCERPKTSAVLLSCSAEDGHPVRPLIRSKTYDILPAIDEEDNLTADQNVHNEPDEQITECSTEMDQASTGCASEVETPTPTERRQILLAIQTSPDDYIYGYFGFNATLKSILEFASQMQGCCYDDHVLRTEDSSQQTFEDLSQTITQARLRHRTLLMIVSRDELLRDRTGK